MFQLIKYYNWENCGLGVREGRAGAKMKGSKDKEVLEGGRA